MGLRFFQTIIKCFNVTFNDSLIGQLGHLISVSRAEMPFLGRFGRWLSQHKRAVSAIAVGTCYTVTGGINFVSKTYYLEPYAEMISVHEFGKPKPVLPELTKLYESVISDLKLEGYEMKLLKPFLVKGFEAYSLGSTELLTGGMIGMPINFTYENVEDIPKSMAEFPTTVQRFDVWEMIVDWFLSTYPAVKTEISLKPLDFSVPEGPVLQKTLILSENAKKFALAQSIQKLRSSLIFMESALGPFFMLLTYILCYKFNDHWKLFNKHRNHRMLMYTIVSGIMYLNYTFFAKALQLYKDTSADEKVGKLSKEYGEGGIEYLSKIIERLRTCRKITFDRTDEVLSDRIYITDTNPFIERLKLMKKIAGQPYKPEPEDNTINLPFGYKITYAREDSENKKT